MIIQELKKNKIEFVFFFIFSIIFYFSIYILKGNTFLSDDDLAHVILKPKTLFECFKSSCDGISIFLNDINNNIYSSDKKIIERQIHRIASQYTFFTDLIYFLFYKIVNDWNYTIILMIIFGSIFKFISLLTISNIFFKNKEKTFFFVFISLVFITTPGFEPHWGQNLATYFFLISLSSIYFKNSNIIKVIFFLLTLTSHAGGIIFGSILALSNFLIKYETRKSFLKNINLIDILFGFLIISSYLFYYYVNLDSAPPQNLYNPENNHIFKNIYSIYHFFKIIPPASAGIIFMLFIISYLMINNFSQKVNLIFLSIAIIYLLTIFTGSALIIFKKSIFLYTLLFYISFFVIFFETLKDVNYENFKSLIFNKKLYFEKKINLILFIPLIAVMATIIENYTIDNPKNFFRSHVSGNINNHNLKTYDHRLKNLDNHDVVYSGSEAGMYYLLNSGLSERKFTWIDLKKTNSLKPGIYNYIFNSKINAGGRLTSNNNLFQFYNSIILTKNNQLVLDLSKLDKKPKKIIFGFKKIDFKKDYNVKIITNSKDTKVIKMINNELLYNNNHLNLNTINLLTKNNLILTKIQLDDQILNWPYNKNMSLEIKGEVYTHKNNDFFSRKNTFVKFDELRNISIKNCKLIQIIDDNLSLNFAKIKCS